MQQTSTLVLSTVPNTQNKQQSETLADDYMPSAHLINNILNFSRSLEVKKSKSVGYIEIVAS